MGASKLPMGDASDFSVNFQPSGKKSDFSANSQPSGSKIDDIYNQLSDDDKKATEKYAQSLLDRSEENNPDMGGEPAPGGEQMPAGAPPIQEVYTMYEGRLIPGRIGCRRKSSKKNR